MRERLLALYPEAGFWARLYLRLRLCLVDFKAVDAALAGRRRVLDLACGYGLLSHWLALSDPRRSVLGVDLSPERVAAARAAAARGSGAAFETADMLLGLPGGFDGIAFIDSLHYFDAQGQARVLGHCFEALLPGGAFVLREQDDHPAWKLAWVSVHERLMTGLGLTKTREDGGLRFLGCRRLVPMLGEAGFEVLEVREAPACHPYPDTLYLCRRP